MIQDPVIELDTGFDPRPSQRLIEPDENCGAQP